MSEDEFEFQRAQPSQPQETGPSVEELEREHDRLNGEWRELIEEERQLIEEGATSLDRLSEIHRRQRAVIDDLWRIEVQLLIRHKDSG